MDYEEMRAFAFREQHGYLPDEQYTPTEEGDPDDPDAREIRAMVEAQYAATNRERARERERYQESERNAELKALLSEHGIEIPEHLA